VLMGGVTPEMKLENELRSAAQFAGFSQAETFSFESPKVFDKLLLSENDGLRKAITISNPLGEDFSIMRTSTVNGMLTSLSTNYNRRNKNVKLYELGRVYLPGEQALPIQELPDERVQLTLGFYGNGDFFDMKGAVEELLDVAGVEKHRDYMPGASAFYKGNGNIPFLHPGRQAAISVGKNLLGYLGEVHPAVLKNYEIGERAYLAVIDLKNLMEAASFEKKYAGVPRFPAIVRDLSMTVPKDLMVGEIEALLRQRGGKLLESYALFDVYEGAQVGEGFKSVAYSCTFRAPDRTLEDADVQKAMKKILDGLGRMGIELRQ
ncbi:MAG: phenylalanine--tRNA ligase subunit beta, partial [Lachnospiraceae bacterium]|nr:phenylalanine--tRNA ligase subunit beta [Lachnospiraceae bacterium]